MSLDNVSVGEQLAAAAGDRLRVLIVGAGAAGLTFGQLLRRQGLHPVIVEKTAPQAESGYMLALMPLVDSALAEIGVTDDYVQRSTPLRWYQVRGRHGQPLREYQMTKLLDLYGDYRGISRGELLQVLSSPGGTVTHQATVSALEQSTDTVRATIAAGTGSLTAEFDLVVAADGLHSATRDLVLDPGQVSTYDTGWGGWVTWGDAGTDQDLGWELWGSGLFIGAYPVKDRLGVIMCGPRSETKAGPQTFADHARRTLRNLDQRVDHVLDQVVHNDEKYFWSLTDCRSDTWSVGRVVLLGDSAAGFLPTAGIGACMAMESAGVLAAHLAGGTADEVPRLLRAYEAAQRPRVEAAQDNSRSLARIMFRTGAIFALARDTAARLAPLEAALRPIRSLLNTQPNLTPQNQ